MCEMWTKHQLAQSSVFKLIFIDLEGLFNTWIRLYLLRFYLSCEEDQRDMWTKF